MYLFSALKGRLGAKCGLKRNAFGDEVDEGSTGLATSGCEGTQPGPRFGPAVGFIAAGDFAGDDCGTKLALGQVVGGGHLSSFEKGE